jgi:hypothetical protein
MRHGLTAERITDGTSAQGKGQCDGCALDPYVDRSVARSNNIVCCRSLQLPWRVGVLIRIRTLVTRARRWSFAAAYLFPGLWPKWTWGQPCIALALGIEAQHLVFEPRSSIGTTRLSALDKCINDVWRMCLLDGSHLECARPDVLQE